MKYIIFLSMLCICGCEGAYKRDDKVLHEAENVAVPDFYRKILGYDSLEVTYFMDKWEVNFCYPNEWEFEKFKNKNVKSITFKYDSIMIINFDSSEVK